MISEAVISAYSKPDRPVKNPHKPGFSVTGISPCPYETYVNFKGLIPRTESGVTNLLMNDGHYQELQILDNIHAAGFKTKFTGNTQLRVTVGRASISGRPDGLILIDGREDMLEIKAMSLSRFSGLKQKGLDAEPKIRCQIQMYMHSHELTQVTQTWLYAKHKDSCRPFDLWEGKDSTYAKPIIQMMDAIVLDGYEPPKEKCALCAGCYKEDFCWGENTRILDLSAIGLAEMPDVVEQWKIGKAYKMQGEELIDDAKVKFIAKLGDKTVLIVDDLKVSRILSERRTIDRDLFIDKFGWSELEGVEKVQSIEQVRITEVVH